MLGSDAPRLIEPAALLQDCRRDHGARAPIATPGSTGGVTNIRVPQVVGLRLHFRIGGGVWMATGCRKGTAGSEESEGALKVPPGARGGATFFHQGRGFGLGDPTPALQLLINRAVPPRTQRGAFQRGRTTPPTAWPAKSASDLQGGTVRRAAPPLFQLSGMTSAHTLRGVAAQLHGTVHSGRAAPHRVTRRQVGARRVRSERVAS